MAITTIGDLAQGFALRQQSSVLKQQMMRLTAELASGTTSDVTRHLAGDFTSLADIRHRLVVLDSHASAATQGRNDSGAMQTTLSRFQERAQSLGESTLAFAMSPGAALHPTVANEARNALGDMLSALNVSIAGRSLFAGDALNEAAVARQQDVMAAIRSAAAGATDAATLTTAMDDFFDSPGGGFDTTVYLGSGAPRAAYPLGEGESVILDLRADDPVFRSTLKQVAIAALMDDPAIALSSSDQVLLARQTGEALFASQDRITAIRADLGFAESRIDRAASRISAETAGLNMLHGDLLGIDPFDAASELDAVQTRLETLYTLTARMSRLNLVNFLS